MADYRKIRAAMSRGYLDFLPEEIYDKSDTSHIVRLMDALCGDSGVIGERKRLSIKRFQTDLYETRYDDLDTVYSDMFKLPRLSSETYAYKKSDLLTWAERDEMDMKDAAYRRRIWTYMLALQYGATLTGVELMSEAACGHPCQIIDMTRYDNSWGILQGDTEYESIWGQQRESDGSTFAIVVMKDGAVTTEESKSISDLVSRLSPQDASFVIVSKDSVLNTLGRNETPDTNIDIAGIESSSDWWNVIRMVTGRNDWDYEKYPQGWIEPNVTKEAPRQALVYSQEERVDYLTMISSVEASSEHVGTYGAIHSNIFTSLREITVDQKISADWAISRASNKWYTSSYYTNGEAVVDWSYPIELSDAYVGTSESGRYQRFWSSAERDGDEWLEIGLKRAVPINRISLNICRKPMQVIPYVSSSDDGSEWVRIMDETGALISYTTRAWGGASIAGEMLTVQFKFPAIEANRIRLEFKRLNVPFRREISFDTYEIVDFLWSIEASNVSIGNDIFSKDDFISTAYFDPFGNRVDTSLSVFGTDRINNDSYWVSQPNIGEDAVEYLVIDLGSRQKVNRIDIGAVFGGCQMNIYSSDDGVIWMPYTGDFTLATARYNLPMRTARYIKLEFTSLNAIPYEVVSSGIMVRTRRFPYAVRNYIDSITEDVRELTLAQRYLTTPQESGSEWDVYNVLPETTSLDPELNGSEVFGNVSYRTFESRIYTDYGDDMLMEQPLILPDVNTSIRAKRSRHMFVDVGKHDYDVRDYERQLSLAYVVGVSHVYVGMSNSLLDLDGMGPVRVPLSDITHVASNDGWVGTGERLVPSTDKYICSFETDDIQTAYAFRSFDFATEQSPAIQRLQYPSNMANEWSGVGAEAYSTEFGTNGTTLAVSPDESETAIVYGVESQPKLVHANSMGDFEVGMFAAEAGTWELEVLDVFDKQITSMVYDVAARKWTTIGVTFTPQAGGGWWNSDYGFRVQIPLNGPIIDGQCIFLPNININDMIAAGMEASGTKLQEAKDIRIVYYNGIELIELPYDCTGNEEIWFRAQQAIPQGYSADGAMHRDINSYLGAYYIYFGNANEVESPDIDYTKVFDAHEFDDTNDFVPAQSGTNFTQSAYADIYDGYRISDGAGFMTIEIDLDDALKNPTTLDGETFDQRYFVDYSDEDSDRQLQLYAYGTQLTFVIYEPASDNSKYENAWVGEYDSLNPQLTTSNTKLLIRWGEQGTEDVYVNGTLDPNEKRRRKIEVYIGEAVKWSCIDNVYDEKYYNGGTY